MALLDERNRGRHRAFQSWPWGTLIVLLLVCAVYVVTLANIPFHAGGGDAVMGEAIMVMILVFVLWVMLAILLAAGGFAGQMPRWAGIALVFLHPLSGVAAFAAIDMCSRMMPWASMFAVLLPALTAGYALWARLTNIHTRFPPQATSAIVLGAILVLSATALTAAANL